MPKKFGINPKAQEAKEREQVKKETSKMSKKQKEEEAYWEDNDKKILQKQQRQVQKQQSEEEKQKKQDEKKKLLEKEQAEIVSNKQFQVLTKQQIKQEQQQIFEKQLEKVQLSDDDKNSDNESEKEETLFDKIEQLYSDGEDFDESIGANQNHLAREQRKRDLERFNEIIDGDGIEDVLKQFQHGTKQMKFKDFAKKTFRYLKAQNPGFRHSQLMEMVYKQWKTDPGNPRNCA